MGRRIRKTDKPLNRPVTNLEQREMQAMRNDGFSLSYIALAFSRNAATVRHHTVRPTPPIDYAKRNAELLRQYERMSDVERIFLARRNGFASLQSLQVTLCVYRRSLRESSPAACPDSMDMEMAA